MSKGLDATFGQIRHTLDAASRILVASHVRPDADAYGSTIAMALHLLGQGKDVTVWNEEGMTGKFRYLPESALVQAPPEHEKRDFDVFLALDTSTKERLGRVLKAAGQVTTWINIDHHVSNHRYGDLNFIDDGAPATGQILFDYFRESGAVITPAMAGNLYAAISTDTGSFQYEKTSPHTFRLVADLVEKGVNVPELSRKMYDSYPRRRLELLKALLNTARFDCDDRVASFCLSLETAKKLAVLPEDNEGLIDHLRAVEGVQVAVFIEELPENKVRVSMRSKEPRFDVCKICGLFGGGGHPQAAGARLSGPLELAEEKVLEAICHEVRIND
ncbi:MAG: bifunctional oligoribonuclease/PAP phosphatase NrnA [Chthoniobacterales bacterium]|jgi:phosphoesterase RecJ-like protein|nr:bifunctional oligoribonuclease/PAP phosphatase NrnA [Chthoniobacterales bacterium]